MKTIKCIHNGNFYVLLMNLPSYRYGISFFISGDFLCFDVYFFLIIAYSLSSFFSVVVYVLYNFSHSFSLNLFVSLNLKCVFYRQRFNILCLFILAIILLTFIVMLIGLRFVHFLFLFFASALGSYRSIHIYHFWLQSFMCHIYIRYKHYKTIFALDSCAYFKDIKKKQVFIFISYLLSLKLFILFRRCEFDLVSFPFCL